MYTKKIEQVLPEKTKKLRKKARKGMKASENRPELAANGAKMGGLGAKRHKVAFGLVITLMVAILASGGVLLWARQQVWRGKCERTRVELTARAEAQIAREEAEKEREERLRQRQERLKSSKLVALTFDDGPSGATTPRLLDILSEKEVKATFFVVGSRARGNPDLVRREEAEGHEVGSHTTRHINFSKVKTAAAVQSEMAEMRGIFSEILGRAPEIMRPPYGNGIRSSVVTENVGVPMIHWSVDTLDWKYKDSSSVRERALAGVYDGAIILMHDIHPTTVDAVAGLIDELREWGYEMVTVSELAELRGVEMRAGQTYFYFKP